MNYLDYLYIIPIALIAIIIHEFSHGFVSYILGDPTPKEDGRLTLNPLNHLDIMGLICLIFFHIGWAKPVRINTMYYKKPRLGTFLVALAGPLSNFIMALIGGLIAGYAYKMNNEIFFYIGLYMTMINVGLCVFNLIPIPPLDGSNIVASFLSPAARNHYMSYARYGTFILFGLIILLDIIESMGMPNILTDFISYIYEWIITFFIDLIN